MQLPVSLILKPSRYLAVLLIAAHGGVAASLVVLSIRSPDSRVAVALLAAVALSLAGLAWQLIRLFGSRRIEGLTLHKDGAVDYWRRDGSAGSARIDPQTTVTPWLTVLLLRSAQTRRVVSLTLLPDALSEEEFRRLRLWLRWLAVEGR